MMGVAGGVLKCECTDLGFIWKATESHLRILERGDVVRGWLVRFIRCPCREMAGAGTESKFLSKLWLEIRLPRRGEKRGEG